MDKTITISTDVFAAIWAQRQQGEDNEDAILRRVFNCGIKVDDQSTTTVKAEYGGVYDSRNEVQFPEGFEIFRIYKRKEYRAIASNGMWVRQDNNKRFSTLNQLNESIAAGPENVWNGNWKYRKDGGSQSSINDLRS